MSSKIFAYGTLEASTDSWLLAAEHVIELDISMLSGFDPALEHHAISVVGTTGFPKHDGSSKLVVEKLVSQQRIRARALQIFESDATGSELDHWLRAERELLSA